jgi:hypothetical protein
MTEETLKEEINLLKKDLKSADSYFINCSVKLLAAENQIDKLKQTIQNIKDGFEGCCYSCEPVGRLNVELQSQLKAIEEDGTEEHNAAISLRSKLSKSRLEIDEWKKVAKQLYSVALHLQAVSNSKNNIVVGPGLYSEAVDSIKQYEKLENL